ncbi:pseudaminic acid synthase [Salinibacter ruber]|uniref:pseudaminic acid synthase n=1 Tax=Salinibacter ruber TaxID=146919 RepID=UPI002166FEA4|nr:pseudaminic acid synthase [Salinibacter ruber]MCS3632505.1 pseudaminic acid synthase [Salinibacter ruber]
MHKNVYCVAEMSANHLNDIDVALQIVEAAADAGADAVKLQTYTPESLSIDVKNKYFKPKEDGLWEGMRPYQLYEEASMPYEWQPKVKEHAEEHGLDCFSSPFDREAVDLMEEMNMPAYKIASLEINDLPLIRYAASRGKPMIMSTGAANLGDIERAVKTCREEGNDDITLLKCTSEYPAPIERANLRTIPHMRETFDVKVGLSDHTLGTTVPVAATALGAQVIEKHLTLDRSFGGPDADFSLEPDEFEAMVDSVREASKAVGDVDYSLSENDAKRRRSLFVVEDVQEGEQFTEANVRSIRPGHGLAPTHLDTVLGSTAAEDLSKGTPLSWGAVR